MDPFAKLPVMKASSFELVRFSPVHMHVRITIRRRGSHAFVLSAVMHDSVHTFATRDFRQMVVTYEILELDQFAQGKKMVSGLENSVIKVAAIGGSIRKASYSNGCKE
ncbi:hypothetical protein POTOM_061849 [Populus tomentosa]|uniref:Uncharacterized protein n=1 Tax=Populus tomentosa TaxID=118781 RepID=A0A8X7XP53_POPTO|nr:hypothetical protein POTOM_061849 [Populus tomentosa]